MKIIDSLLNGAAVWKRVSELILSPNLTQEISNWHELLKDFLIPTKQEYSLNLRRGGKLALRGGTFDKWPVSEIIVRDDYRLRNLPQPNIIIDLGAGIGDFCVYACLLFPKVKMYAYEPDEDTYRHLAHNIKINALTKRVHIFKLAVTKQSDQKRTSINQTKGFTPLIRQFPTSPLFTTTTLEQIFALHKIVECDLLKIDVEGAEYAILYSLPPTIYKKIKRIHLECHNFGSPEFNYKSLEHFLEDIGFSVEVKKSLDQNICMLYGLNQSSN